MPDELYDEANSHPQDLNGILTAESGGSGVISVCVGQQGPQGPRGPAGIRGLQGPQGFRGLQGYQGYQGLQGLQGLQGRQGIQGLQGLQGFQGLQGIQGLQGFQGFQGFQGLQGFQGFQGVAGNQLASVVFGVDGGGQPVTLGDKGWVRVPYSGTITAWEITADQSGSCVVDIQKSTYSGFPVFSSIAGTEKPTLSSQQKNQNLVLSTWTTALVAGDYLRMTVESAIMVTRVVVSIAVTRS